MCMCAFWKEGQNLLEVFDVKAFLDDEFYLRGQIRQRRKVAPSQPPHGEGRLDGGKHGGQLDVPEGRKEHSEGGEKEDTKKSDSVVLIHFLHAWHANRTKQNKQTNQTTNTKKPQKLTRHIAYYRTEKAAAAVVAPNDYWGPSAMRTMPLEHPRRWWQQRRWRRRAPM